MAGGNIHRKVLWLASALPGVWTLVHLCYPTHNTRALKILSGLNGIFLLFSWEQWKVFLPWSGKQEVCVKQGVRDTQVWSRMKRHIVITFALFCDLDPRLASGCETKPLFLSPLRANAHSYLVQRHEFSHRLIFFFLCMVLSALKSTAVLINAWYKGTQFMRPLTIDINTSASSLVGFLLTQTPLFFFSSLLSGPDFPAGLFPSCM